MCTSSNARDHVETLIRAWTRARHRPGPRQEPEVLETLATVLAAYGLGSRTARKALVKAGNGVAGWSPPSRPAALALATEIMRLAEDLRADQLADGIR